MSYPAGWALVSVTGTYVARDGSPSAGSVEFSSPQLVLRSGTVVPAADISFPLDVNGSFTGQIPATDDPNATPINWLYIVTEHVPGGRSGLMISVPHTSTGIDMSTVVPVTQPVPSSPPYPLATLQQLAAQSSPTGASLIGFQQSGAGAVGRTVQDSLSNVIYYGDHATLQESLDESYASGKPFIGQKGVTVTLTSPLTIHPNIVADFAGMTVIAGPNITSGPAIIVDGAESPTATAGVVRNLFLLRPLVSGHQDTTSNVDGISIGGASGQVSSMGWYDLKVFGFRDCLRFDGPNCYLNHFYNPQIGWAWRNGVAAYANSNSGENNSFHGGSIFNCNNTSFNGTGVYWDPATSGFEFAFFGTSFDYNDLSWNNNSGRGRAFGCHFENNNNNEHIRLSYTAGKARPSLQMYGGSIGGGPGVTTWSGIPTENATGRVALVTANVGDVDVFIDSTICGGYYTGEYVTEIVKVQDGGNLRRAHIDPIMEYSAGTTADPINISLAINDLYVSTSSLAGWTINNATGGTISFDSTAAQAPDIGSRKFVGTAGSSLSTKQVIPVRAKKLLIFKTYIRIDSLSGGYCAPRVDFLAQDGTTVISGQIGTNINTVTSGFVPAWVAMPVPNGAVSASVQNYCSGFTGTAWFSNEHVWTV